MRKEACGRLPLCPQQATQSEEGERTRGPAHVSAVLYSSPRSAGRLPSIFSHGFAPKSGAGKSLRRLDALPASPETLKFSFRAARWVRERRRRPAGVSSARACPPAAELTSGREDARAPPHCAFAV